MIPWLYVGMTFSTFCWHVEDHYTYSINYHHLGETKTWYGIPHTSADLFEQTMREQAPELFNINPDLLFHLTTMISPGLLKANGVEVFALDQREGEFVVTFPRAYHSGFNHGFNFCEAVNFATIDWLPFGEECVELYSKFAKQPVFSHHELVITLVDHNLNNETAPDIRNAFEDMWEEEMLLRDNVREMHWTSEEKVAPILHCDENQQCKVCKSFSYLSAVVCENHPGFTLCLKHAGEKVFFFS